MQQHLKNVSHFCWWSRVLLPISFQFPKPQFKTFLRLLYFLQIGSWLSKVLWCQWLLLLTAYILEFIGDGKMVIFYHLFFNLLIRVLYLKNASLRLLLGCCLVAKLCPTFATPWTVADLAPLPMGFSRQEYWRGLPFPSPPVIKTNKQTNKKKLLTKVLDQTASQTNSAKYLKKS